MSRERAFTIIEVVIVVAVIAIISLVGWRIWDANYNRTADSSNTPTVQQTQAEIKTSADLDKAVQTLDDADILGSSETDLDAETDF